MTFLFWTILIVQEITQASAIPSRQPDIPFMVTPDFDSFRAESNFSQVKRDGQTVQEAIGQIQTGSSSVFSHVMLLGLRNHMLNMETQLHRVLGEPICLSKRATGAGSNFISAGQDFFGKAGNILGLASKKVLMIFKNKLQSFPTTLNPPMTPFQRDLKLSKKVFLRGSRTYTAISRVI